MVHGISVRYLTFLKRQPEILAHSIQEGKLFPEKKKKEFKKDLISCLFQVVTPPQQSPPRYGITRQILRSHSHPEKG